VEQMIVLVEDNENARDALASYLRLEGHTVVECETLAAAGESVQRQEPDLLILDVMLPDGDGFLFAKRLRQKSDTPILFLTARDQESDRITGLELGAEDYVVKPFSPREVVLRVNNILRRTRTEEKTETSGREQFNHSNDTLLFDHDTHRLTVNGAIVEVTAAEWTILYHLASSAPRVYDRSQLLNSCLGSIAEGSERTIDTHIKNLRRKLGGDHWIETVRGFGYRFSGERV
jgi:DNA-binding response OmpR family regulator